MAGDTLMQYRIQVGIYHPKATKLSCQRLSFRSCLEILCFLLLVTKGLKAIPLVLLMITLQPRLKRSSSLQDTNTHSKTALNVNCINSQIVQTIVIFIFILLILLAGDVHPNPGPVVEKYLTAVHNNVCSLRNKIQFLEPELRQYDIITLSETWLSPEIDNCSILFKDFHPPIRKDRLNDAHGGVAIYLKKDLICKPRHDLDIPLLEAVWVETKIAQETLLIGSFYRPPNADASYWQLIDDAFEKAGNTPHKYIVLGDFNINCSNNIPPILQDIMNKNNLKQFISTPTRVTQNTSTLIDLLFTPCLDIIKTTDVLPPICSDHSVSYAKINQHKQTPTSFRRTLYNYSKLNRDQYLTTIQGIDWFDIINENDLDLAAGKFSDQLMICARHCMPVKEVKINVQDKPWITAEIKELIKKKNRIHRKATSLGSVWAWNRFKQIRNELTSKIRQKKKDYETNLDQRVSSPESFNSKDWWKLVRNFMTNKGLPSDDIPPIEEDGKIYYSHSDKAEIFNKYFVQQTHIHGINDQVPLINQEANSIENLDITSNMVKQILKNLDLTKAVGPDLVHNKLLHIGAETLSEPLSLLFNRSLSEGRFPASWKQAHVTPIHKKGPKEKCSNYRPISLLSCVGKVMEKCVQKHIFDYLSSNNLLTSSQSGFIPGDSTVYQLITIYEDF